jgi:hypothetical protein
MPFSSRYQEARMLSSTLNHHLTNVIPAAQDYDRAENELSVAFAQNPDPAHWATAGQYARRRAAEVALPSTALPIAPPTISA